MTAIWADNALINSSSWYLEPWWHTLYMSTSRTDPRISFCAGGSRSPAVKRLQSAVVTSIAILELLISEPSPGMDWKFLVTFSGHNTSNWMPAICETKPFWTVTIVLSCKSLKEWELSSKGSRLLLIHTCPTCRDCTSPESPPTWSAWKWDKIKSGISVIPKFRRHLSSATGSGPTSITIAWPPCRFITIESPWPTSQFAICQSPAGQRWIQVKESITTTITAVMLRQCFLNNQMKATSTATIKNPIVPLWIVSTGNPALQCAIATIAPAGNLMM